MKERQYEDFKAGTCRLLSQLSDDEIAELIGRVRSGTVPLRDNDPELAMIALEIEIFRRSHNL